MRPRTRFRRFLPVILVAVGIAAFVLWPRPALQLYTTPPLDSKGTRIQLLIPRGWVQVSRYDRTGEVFLMPQDSFGWLLDGVRKLVKSESKYDGLYLGWIDDPRQRSSRV